MTKSASAAARMRLSIVSQGVSRSDSEIAQKSWPSGAPARAAAACMAEMPGATTISARAAPSGRPPAARHSKASAAMA